MRRFSILMDAKTQETSFSRGSRAMVIIRRMDSKKKAYITTDQSRMSRWDYEEVLTTAVVKLRFKLMLVLNLTRGPQ
jgi:hypothetical protein